MRNAVIAAAAIAVFAIVLLASTDRGKSKQPVSQARSEPESGWLVDFKKAQAQAKSSKKLLLLDFTGSDWCPGCILLHRQVFATDEFRDYANKNLVLVELDFPRARVQRPEIAAQNQTLAVHFGIQVFPTVVILNSDGKKVGAFVGYEPGEGANAFIAELDKFRKG